MKNKLVASEETKSDSDLIREAIHKILLEFRELNSNFFDISHLTQVINEAENQTNPKIRNLLTSDDKNCTFYPLINKNSCKLDKQAAKERHQ